MVASEQRYPAAADYCVQRIPNRERLLSRVVPSPTRESTGEPDFSRFLSAGSVAERVARHSTVPVLTTRAQKERISDA